ncbi:RcnB family protein [Cupriavidus basilensis]
MDDWRQYNLPQPTKGRHWVGGGSELLPSLRPMARSPRQAAAARVFLPAFLPA